MRDQRIINRPRLTTPERQCLCGRTYRVPWAWALILPSRKLIDLCGRCSRELRYGNEHERAAVAQLIEDNTHRRRAA